MTQAEHPVDTVALPNPLHCIDFLFYREPLATYDHVYKGANQLLDSIKNALATQRALKKESTPSIVKLIGIP